MRKISLAFILLATFALQSCNNYLDNKPKGYTIPQYFEDYALLLNSMNLGFLGAVYPVYITDDAELGDKDAPVYFSIEDKREEELNLFKFKKGDIFAMGSNDYFFDDCYSHIYTYNVVINNIMGVPDGIEKEKLRIKAQALVGRAFTYLQLVNIYAKHYNPATAKTDLGVPIVLKEDINNTYVRNSVQEVYDLIIRDLIEAIPNLDEATAHAFHPAKLVGAGLLARVYLYMGEYDKALTRINEAIAVNKTAELIDFKRYTTIDGESYNRVVDENEEGMPTRNMSKANIYIKMPSNDLSSFICASDDLMNVFEKDLPIGAIDKRVELFYAKDKANTFEPMEFPGKTLYIAHVMPNMGLTLQELYLIAAECEARVGTASNASGHLNTLRNMRIVNNVELNLSSKEEALRITLDERRREMAFWGYTRLIDLKRLNLDPRFAKTITHKGLGETWTLPANDNRYIMPLPHSMKTFNPNLPVYER